MSDTRERILRTALHLFARDGYEAVSVRMIAGKLGMTKGSLYRHYRSKRDIFDSIVKRMEQNDFERARAYQMPEGTFEQMAEVYRSTPIEKIAAYTEAQFRYWTEDEFASDFRRLLILEQYRDPEMAALYQNHLAAGPVGYMTDLFRELMGRGRGRLKPEDPRLLALEFYAPIPLLMSIFDTAEDRTEAIRLVQAHIKRFVRLCAAEEAKPTSVESRLEPSTPLGPA